MRKLVSIWLLAIIPLIGMAQKIKLEGTVGKEDGSPLEMANVIAFKKGTKQLQSYSITDSKGKFMIHLLEFPKENTG